MLLTVDIGNTNITLGLFDGINFIQEFRLSSGKDVSICEYRNLLSFLLKDYFVDCSVIASVVDGLGEKLKESVDSLYDIDSLCVSNDINLGIKIVADNPQEVGADRIANAVAVARTYKSAVIVIDFGTATTFDIVNSKKEFCGGIIIPGLKTQLNSLYTSTSKLPEIDLDKCEKVLGTNTKDAILAGVVRGSACMADGLIELCKKELGEDISVVLTGGHSGLISEYMDYPVDSINPILTLEGLRDIYFLNR